MASQKRDDDDLLTVAEVAARWHLTIRTVHRYITTGKLRPFSCPVGSTASESLTPTPRSANSRLRGRAEMDS
jgi:hypothetical protein